MDVNSDACSKDCVFSLDEVEVSRFLQDLSAARQELGEYYRPNYRTERIRGSALSWRLLSGRAWQTKPWYSL